MIDSLDTRALLAQTFEMAGVNRLCRLTRAWNGLLTLRYGRIGNAIGSQLNRDVYSATEEEFDGQIAFLKQNFDVIGLGDLGDVLNRKFGRFVMITFDDGYRDGFERAFPILREHHVPATFFIDPQSVESSRVAWWDEIAWLVQSSLQSGIENNIWTIHPIEFDEPDRTQAIRKLISTYKMLDPHETETYLDFLAAATGHGRCPMDAKEVWMSWEMVHAISQSGMSIGLHSNVRATSSALRPEEQDRKIEQSANRIEEQTGQRPIAFSDRENSLDSSYEITRACLNAYGFRFAFAGEGGYSPRGICDPFAIPRVSVNAHRTSSAFHAVASLPQVFA